jgi:hypothetical protein
MGKNKQPDGADHPEDDPRNLYLEPTESRESNDPFYDPYLDPNIFPEVYDRPYNRAEHVRLLLWWSFIIIGISVAIVAIVNIFGRPPRIH